RAKVQFSTLICGVGPAERIGNSVVTYCPGGTRSLSVCCSCRLDRKPRETTVWFIVFATFLLALRLFDLRKRLLFVVAQNNARVDQGCAKSSKLEKVIANGRSTNAR